MPDDLIPQLNAALEGRYQIQEELGEGGMATVYLAQDLKHNRQVALKVMKPELTAVVGAERFLTEIETTANLTHPHILPLHDSGEANGFLFYAMPYVEGESLRDKLDREKQLPVDEAVRLTVDLGEALDYAHRHGVIHRDIKPGNILVHEHRPLIADFGIALAVGAAGGPRLTETGLSVGTPYYMSPEQATGDQVVGPQTDIYALGCVLYEMLVGEPPYTGATAQAVLGKIISGGQVSAARERSSIPPNVDAAIRKALEKLPADRFATAGEMGKALRDRSFRHGGVDDREEGTAGHWKGLATAMSGVAVVLAFLLAWALARPAPRQDVVRYTLELPFDARNSYDFGTNMALSPDGTKLVYAVTTGGVQQLWLRERHQLEARLLSDTDGGRQPFFAPDGERIGFVTEDREVRVVSLGGEPPVTLAASGVVRGGGSWSEDGYLYLSTGSQETDFFGPLGRLPEGGGELEIISTLDEESAEVTHLFPEALPGGQGVLFMVWRGVSYNVDSSYVAVLDPASGEHRVLFPGIMPRWSTTGHIVFVGADGALRAAPFDPGSLTAEGPPVPLLEGVRIDGLATADLVLSASGTLLYVPASGDNLGTPLVWVDRQGSTEHVDTTWGGEVLRPALSPDGTRIAADSSGESVWVKSLVDGVVTKLWSDTVAANPEWSPDGRSLIFLSGSSATINVFTQRADGSSDARPLLTTEGAVVEAEWSKDGEWLIYVEVTQNAPFGPGDILAVQSGADATPRALVSTDANEVNPSLSPDGRWLAYASTRSGRPEVYVRPFPNVEEARWQISTQGGFQPLWARSGRELFYMDLANRTVTAEVEIRPGLSVVGQRVLFDAGSFQRLPFGQRYYDVALDDEHFLMTQISTLSATHDVVVVENFLRELQERMES